MQYAIKPSRIDDPWPYIKLLAPCAEQLAVFISTSVLLTFLGLLNPLVSKIVFDFAYPLGDLRLFSMTVIFSMCIYLFDFGLGYVSGLVSFFLNQKIYYGLSEALFQHVLKNLSPIRLKLSVSDIEKRITQDVGGIQNLLTQLPKDVAVEIARLATMLAITFSMSPILSLVALLSVPVYFIEKHFFASIQEVLVNEDELLTSSSMEDLQVKLRNLKTVQLFNQEEVESVLFKGRNFKMYLNSLQQGIVDILSEFSSSVSLKLYGAVISWLTGYFIITGRITIGEGVSLSLYFMQIPGPFRSLSSIIYRMKIGRVQLRRVNELFLMSGSQLIAPSSERPVCGGSGKPFVRFDQVDFSYNAGNQVLQNVNLIIERDEVIGLTGKSGAGKSTLANLLLKFLEPQAGEIQISGRNIRDVSNSELRKTVGLVAPEISLFRGTIRESIKYGNPGLTDGELSGICEVVGLESIMARFKDGVDSEIGHDGLGLSSGQRQRVQIARALASNPEILILDEATSALDITAESELMSKLKAFMAGKVIIVVSHRPSTLKFATKVFLLENSRVLECRQHPY